MGSWGNSLSSCLTYRLLLPWHTLFCLPGHPSLWVLTPPHSCVLSCLPNPLHLPDPHNVGLAQGLGHPLFSFFSLFQTITCTLVLKDHPDMDVSPNSISSPDLTLNSRLEFQVSISMWKSSRQFTLRMSKIQTRHLLAKLLPQDCLTVLCFWPILPQPRHPSFSLTPRVQLIIPDGSYLRNMFRT